MSSRGKAPSNTTAKAENKCTVDALPQKLSNGNVAYELPSGEPRCKSRSSKMVRARVTLPGHPATDVTLCPDHLAGLLGVPGVNLGPQAEVCSGTKVHSKAGCWGCGGAPQIRRWFGDQAFRHFLVQRSEPDQIKIINFRLNFYL